MQLETICYFYCSRTCEKGIKTRLVQIQRIKTPRKLSEGILSQEYNDEDIIRQADESDAISEEQVFNRGYHYLSFRTI